MIRKIILTAILTLITTPIFATSPFLFNTSIDFCGNLNASIDGSSNNTSIETGFSLGAEYLFPSKDKFDYGLGVKYQIKRENFSFIPIYAFGRYTLDNNVVVYGQVGYNFLVIDNADDLKVNGGYCLGIGANYPVYKNIKTFAEFGLNNGSVESGGVNISMVYSKFSVGVQASLD